jgi:hypothetical protein
MLRRTGAALVLAFCALMVFTDTLSTQSQPLRIDGYVRDGASRPIPALTVYLVHPSVGRSQPRITDSHGYFAFESVPSVPDAYYLEVYWGKTLMYRQSVRVDADIHWPDIVLD